MSFSLSENITRRFIGPNHFDCNLINCNGVTLVTILVTVSLLPSGYSLLTFFMSLTTVFKGIYYGIEYLSADQGSNFFCKV